MTNKDIWQSILSIIHQGFTPNGISKLEEYAENDFHRQSSMAALREVQIMSLHPYSREQKLNQINSLRQKAASKESSNAERRKLNA